MAAYIGFQPTDFFNTNLWTGTGAEQTITGVGFESDFTWMKKRDGVDNHALYDTVRGATKRIMSNEPDVESTIAQGLKSWTSDGFVVGTDAEGNADTKTYVGWNWKAGTTSGITGGTITPSSYSINTTSGFGIYTWAGTGVAGTIAHGLGVTPKMIILKCTTHDNYWFVYHNGIAADAETDYLNLNDTTAAGDNASIWNDTAPTSSVFSIGTNTDVNGSGRTYVAYVFADVKGYSSFNSYTGNGNADGPFVYTGFRPAWVVVKRTDSTGAWRMIDNKRNSYNGQYNTLEASSTAAQYTASDDFGNTDLLSNGFKLREGTYAQINASGGTYVYMTFAEFPFVSSNSKAGVAR